MSTDLPEAEVPLDLVKTGPALHPLDEAAWSAAAPYLSTALLETLSRHPDRPPTWIDSLDGTLLFADVSGFTSLSERLAAFGREGAELLTDLINSYFQLMLDIARGHGGSNVKFGGDALVLLFTGEDHADRAVATALAMQGATRRFTSIRVRSDRVRLSMSVAVHSGRFWFAGAGLPERRMQHLLLGRDVSRLTHTEGLAAAGEVLVTGDVLSKVRGMRLGGSRGEAHHVLRLSRRPVAASPPQQDGAPPLVPELLAYLPPPIAQALRTGDRVRDIEGEHRKVSIMFINVLDVNELLEEQGPDVLLDQLQAYLTLVMRLSDRHGAFMVGNDVDARGLKLILLFGAPVAHERDAASALRLAVELNAELPRLSLRLRHRIGVHSGVVFAGEVGSTYRREYTVMGDAVNLAARLMGAASPGQVLVSRQIADEAGPGFILREMPPIEVKGKKKPVGICLAEGERSSAPIEAAHHASVLLGREAEIASLFRLCREVEGRRGRCLAISGEAGMGKSRLALEFQQYVCARGWTVHRGQCYSHTAATPFAPWVHLLNSFFDIDAAEPVEARTEQVLASIRRLKPELATSASLLNGLLSLSISPSDAVRFLDDEARRRRLFELVAVLLQAAAEVSPLLILLEDLHWADYSSMQLANHIGAGVESSRLVMCLTYRPRDGLQIRLPPGSTVTFALGELESDACLQLVRGILDRPELPSRVAEAILSKAGGNPLFVEMVSLSLRQSGALDRVLSAPSFRVAEEMAALDISDRIQALIMSRMDALPDLTRDVLRAAAVVGNTFDLPTLESVLDPDADGASVETQIQELMQSDFVHPGEDDRDADSYRFKHALIQEVAYDSLSFARRRRLHERTASYLENTYRNHLELLYGVLVHHYERSGNEAKTLTYAVKAGDRARQVFAHEEAIDYYRRGLGAIDDRGSTTAYERSFLLERIGDCYDVRGGYNDATGSFLHALREWRKASRYPAPPPFLTDVTGGIPAKARAAVLCRKIGESYENQSDFDLSLKWLEAASQALPPRQPLLAAQISVMKTLSLLRKGMYDEAIRCGRTGLVLSRRSGDPGQLALAHDMLASPLRETGDLKRAARHFRTAVRLYAVTEDLLGQARANSNLGACYQQLGDLDGAIHHYEIALALCERVRNRVRAAVAHNNIGEVLLAQGRLEEAASRFLKVIAMHDEVGGSRADLIGYALINLSRAYQLQRDYQGSRESLARGMATLRKAGARGLVAEARIQQAELELETGEPEAALRTCSTALREARHLGMKLIEARGLRVLGRIALHHCRCGEAEANLRESATLADRLGADHDQGLALVYLAELYGRQTHLRGFRQRQRLALRQAIAIFRRLGTEAELRLALRSQAEMEQRETG